MHLSAPWTVKSVLLGVESRWSEMSPGADGGNGFTSTCSLLSSALQSFFFLGLELRKWRYYIQKGDVLLFCASTASTKGAFSPFVLVYYYFYFFIIPCF